VISVTKGDKKGSTITSLCEPALFESQNPTAARTGMPGSMAKRIHIATESKIEAEYNQRYQLFPSLQATMVLAIAAEVTANAKGSDQSLSWIESIPVLRKIEAKVMTAIHQR
jgi:hypothetical protein